jgi:hypothetical protein
MALARFKAKGCAGSEAKYLRAGIARAENGALRATALSCGDQASHVYFSAPRGKEPESEPTGEEEASLRQALGKLMWVARLTRSGASAAAAARARKRGGGVKLKQDSVEDEGRATAVGGGKSGRCVEQDVGDHFGKLGESLQDKRRIPGCGNRSAAKVGMARENKYSARRKSEAGTRAPQGEESYIRK